MQKNRAYNAHPELGVGRVLVTKDNILDDIANKASEEETDMSKVGIDLERYKNFASGFFAAAADGLTQTEKDFMTLGAITIGIELGMRFLGDYLNGDVYFSVDKDIENHNLIRAKTQMELLKQIEEKEDEMKGVIKKYGF